MLSQSHWCFLFGLIFIAEDAYPVYTITCLMFSKKTHTEFNKIFNEEKFLFFKKRYLTLLNQELRLSKDGNRG